MAASGWLGKCGEARGLWSVWSWAHGTAMGRSQCANGRMALGSMAIEAQARQAAQHATFDWGLPIVRERKRHGRRSHHGPRGLEPHPLQRAAHSSCRCTISNILYILCFTISLLYLGTVAFANDLPCHYLCDAFAESTEYCPLLAFDTLLPLFILQLCPSDILNEPKRRAIVRCTRSDK